MIGPDKKKLYPNENIKTVCYISNLPKRSNVEIGEYTYYSDNKKSPEKFYDNIEHHYEFLGDKLIIGNFCAIRGGQVYYEWLPSSGYEVIDIPGISFTKYNGTSENVYSEIWMPVKEK